MNDRCKVSPDCFPAIFNLIEKHTPMRGVSGSFQTINLGNRSSYDEGRTPGGNQIIGSWWGVPSHSLCMW